MGINLEIKRDIFVFVLLFVFLWMGLSGCKDGDSSDNIDIGQSLSAVDALPCFARATKVIPIAFPRDHGSHDRFQTEWWYYTGNLDTPDGRHFGYQLTFFRRALLCGESENGDDNDDEKGHAKQEGQSPEAPVAPSKWRTGQLYLAHFAVTDVEAGRFYSDHRMARRALGLAGAEASPYRVWLEKWQVAAASSGGIGLEGEVEDRLSNAADLNLTMSVGSTETLSVQMSAHSQGFSVDFILSPVKPVVLQGKRGLSQKSEKEGNASYYYSMTRSHTRGVIRTEAGEFQVTGTSWFDHEWSTSALGADERGWDWISIHLEDQRDFMVCQVRKIDGTPNPFSFGCLSYPDGRYEILSGSDFTLQVTDHWKSDASGARYPSRWRLMLPGHDLDMRITPYLDNQEHLGGFVYWEGCVQVEGKEGVSGSGYIEMTGYL